jgi:hypothetical protein
MSTAARYQALNRGGNRRQPERVAKRIIATIQHVADPVGVLKAVQALLKPDGRAVLVTDCTDTLDFRLTHKRVWGGYHFPRHWNPFNRKSLQLLAETAGMEVVAIESVMSPVNWVYSIRDGLVDAGYPSWLVEQFSLKASVSLAVFKLVDIEFHLFKRAHWFGSPSEHERRDSCVIVYPNRQNIGPSHSGFVPVGFRTMATPRPQEKWRD